MLCVTCAIFLAVIGMWSNISHWWCIILWPFVVIKCSYYWYFVLFIEYSDAVGWQQKGHLAVKKVLLKQSLKVLFEKLGITQNSFRSLLLFINWVLQTRQQVHQGDKELLCFFVLEFGLYIDFICSGGMLWRWLIISSFDNLLNVCQPIPNLMDL